MVPLKTEAMLLCAYKTATLSGNRPRNSTLVTFCKVFCSKRLFSCQQRSRRLPGGSVYGRTVSARAIRKPTKLMPFVGDIMNLLAERAISTVWFQLPPRKTLNFPCGGPVGSTKACPEVAVVRKSTNQSRVHSQTLPCISYNPHGFGFLRPTGWVVASLFSSVHACWSAAAVSSPKLNRLVVPARQAY